MAERSDLPVAVPGPAPVPHPDEDRHGPHPSTEGAADPVVSPADTPEELIERLRGAANYEFGNLNEDQRNLYRAAADAIESRNALLHGADVDHAALLAVGGRGGRQIARLTEALKRAAQGPCLNTMRVGGCASALIARKKFCPSCTARAVLADEEDARP